MNCFLDYNEVSDLLGNDRQRRVITDDGIDRDLLVEALSKTERFKDKNILHIGGYSVIDFGYKVTYTDEH